MKIYYDKKETDLLQLFGFSLEQKVRAWLIGELHGNGQSLELERQCIDILNPEYVLAECNLSKRAKELQGKASLVDCDIWRERAYDFASDGEELSAIREEGMSKCLSSYLTKSLQPLLVIVGDNHARQESRIFTQLDGEKLLVFRPLQINSRKNQNNNEYILIESLEDLEMNIESYQAFLAP